jgi:hypothetical protein
MICSVVSIVLLVGAIRHFLEERRRHAFAIHTQMTQLALGDLQGYLTWYLVHHGRLPGPTLRDAIDAIHQDGWKSHESIDGPFIVRGVDGWGRPFVYEMHDPQHAMIRSVGPNGVDENGEGDDIQREVPFP